jgi:hypothetical protein
MAAAMIDLETLATSPDCVILTLGAVMFDPYSKIEPFNPLYLRIDADEQMAMGRTWTEDTITWWGNQAPEIQEDALGEEDRVSVTDAIDQFHKWVCHADTVWANGSIFDIMVLENLYRQLELVPPWQYYNIRDVRTVFNMGVAHKMDKSNLHNALADANQQAIGIQNCFSDLGVTAPWDKK